MAFKPAARGEWQPIPSKITVLHSISEHKSNILQGM